MGVLTAVKQNGIVYMGADTQIVHDTFQQNPLMESGYKIQKCAGGLLVASDGDPSAFP